MAGKARRVPIKRKLFRTYATLYGAMFLLLLAGFSWIAATDINRKIIVTQRQMIANMTENIRAHFTAMNDLSMRLVTDQEFVHLAVNTMQSNAEKGVNQSNAFAQLFIACRDMFQKDWQIGIYNRAGYYTYLGRNYYIEPIAPGTVDTFVDYGDTGVVHVERREANPFLSASMPSALFEEELQPSICLWRTVSQNMRFGNAMAVLEIYERYDEFEKHIQSLCSNSNIEGLQVAIYDRFGQAVFHREGFLIPDGVSEGEQRINGDLLTFNSLPTLGLRLYFHIPVSSSFSDLYWFIGLVALLGMGSMLLILLTTHRMARVFSGPIAALCKQVEHLGDHNAQKVDTEIIELDFLAETYFRLQANLNHSIDEVVDLRTAETNAKMLALQAQMQPHFLHNALTTIASMAEEQGNESVSAMCASLTSMLRYITADVGEGVPLFEEINHLDNYLCIMNVRFPDAEVTHSIPLEMLNARVPKLSVQPIVENSFKHAGRKRLQVSVRGELLPNGWRIIITDNGRGFEEGTIQALRDRAEAILDGESPSAMSIDGMGLVNIYLRLRLFYHEQMIFHLENVEQGARVIIGSEGNADG